MPNSVADYAERLVNEDKFEEAISYLMPHVVMGNRHPHVMFLLGRSFLNLKSPVVAEFCYLDSLKNDRRSSCLIDYGRALVDQARFDEAYDAFLEAYRQKPTGESMINLSNMAIQVGKVSEGIEWANQVLRNEHAVRPEIAHKAHVNVGFAKLCEGDHAKGWHEYAKGVGHLEWRERKIYGGERVWRGEPVDRLAVYAEQGLGDQVLFACAFDNLRKANPGTEVIIDCHWRLQTLFQRSFPWAQVHGTQFVAEPLWGDFLDASCAMSELMPMFFASAVDFDGEPYLKACPKRVEEYSAALDSHHHGKSGLKIGVAFTGGVPATQGQLRSGSWAEWKAILPQGDHTYINMEYRDSDADNDSEVLNFPGATRSKNVDDIAALLASVDLLVGVPTTAIHLAGALGVPTLCLTDQFPHCFFGREGERLPYYDSVRLIRREDGTWGKYLEEARRIIEERTWPIATSSSPLDRGTTNSPTEQAEASRTQSEAVGKGRWKTFTSELEMTPTASLAEAPCETECAKTSPITTGSSFSTLTI